MQRVVHECDKSEEERRRVILEEAQSGARERSVEAARLRRQTRVQRDETRVETCLFAVITEETLSLGFMHIVGEGSECRLWEGEGKQFTVESALIHWCAFHP